MNSTVNFSFADLQSSFDLTPEMLVKLELFIQQLLEANQTTNLTSIIDFEEALIKHLYDSLTILKWPDFDKISRVIDIGSGAGIPALPLAICNPQKQFTILEATQKKVHFQEQILLSLKLDNVSLLWGRAEEFGHSPDHRQKYDLVLARAVSAAASLAELTIPFAKLSGYIAFYKGQDYQTELQESDYAVELLGGKVSDVYHFQLPKQYGERNLIILEKIKDSPGNYPRNNGIPQKKPLRLK